MATDALENLRAGFGALWLLGAAIFAGVWATSDAWSQTPGSSAGCGALYSLHLFLALPQTQAAATPATLALALEQALGAGQISPDERRAFDLYAARLAQGAGGPLPVGSAELLRRHVLCLAKQDRQTEAPDLAKTPARATARHALPETLPAGRPGQSEAPVIEPATGPRLVPELLAKLRFLLAVVLCGLLGALVWSRLNRLREAHKRQARRHICLLPTVFSVGALSHLGFIVDISALGCKLETRGQDLATGDSLRLLLPGDVLQAQVIWTTRTHAGLIFARRLPRERLRALVQGATQGATQGAQAATGAEAVV